jgi:hypothetical protein
MSTFTLRHLCFSGPRRKPAVVKFSDGLNVIYGPSNTGKSSILEAIDFMLGREEAPKELPEHLGYEEIFLGIRFLDGTNFTLCRSIKGGDYKLLEGLHFSIPEGLKFEVLKAKTATKKLESVSNFILKRIDLFGAKLKKNARNEKKSLTLRTLLPLFFINERDIQGESSPFISGQYIEKTYETSRLRYLLTGVDDSSLIEEKIQIEARISSSARVGLLGDLVDGMKKKIVDVSSEDTSIEELSNQLALLEQSIETANSSLSVHQESYYEALARKNDEQNQFKELSERTVEVNAMIVRFGLLLKHYESDIERLDGIIESGSLIGALPDTNCPLCGASPENHDEHQICENNIGEITAAATAEREKVLLLRQELSGTVEQLETEKHRLDEGIMVQREKLNFSSLELQSLQPDLTASRNSYSQLVSKKSEVSRAIELFESLEELEERLSEDEEVSTREIETTDNVVPETSLFELAKDIKFFLNEWSLPNSSTIYFSSDTNDIVLDGKHRRSNGKGHRSITHAAVTLGLARHLQRAEMPHAGFVVLDSPLIAFEEPDKVDEVSQTDLNKKFFDSLEGWDSMQTIIFENKKSVPDNIDDYRNVVQFTQNRNVGRYGFFPLIEN